jgi:hypothetical protein
MSYCGEYPLDIRQGAGGGDFATFGVNADCGESS